MLCETAFVDDFECALNLQCCYSATCCVDVQYHIIRHNMNVCSTLCMVWAWFVKKKKLPTEWLEWCSDSMKTAGVRQLIDLLSPSVPTECTYNVQRVNMSEHQNNCMTSNYMQFIWSVHISYPSCAFSACAQKLILFCLMRHILYLCVLCLAFVVWLSLHG